MKRFKLYVIRAIIKCEVPQKRRRGLWHLSRQAAAAYASKALYHMLAGINSRNLLSPCSGG